MVMCVLKKMLWEVFPFFFFFLSFFSFFLKALCSPLFHHTGNSKLGMLRSPWATILLVLSSDHSGTFLASSRRSCGEGQGSIWISLLFMHMQSISLQIFQLLLVLFPLDGNLHLSSSAGPLPKVLQGREVICPWVIRADTTYTRNSQCINNVLAN